jgi:glutathione S-transferase
MAGELGLAYEHIPTAVGADGSRLPDFLAINPNGHVPAIDDDGVVIWESLAINLYLAKKHGGPLAPANIAEDGQMMMWALWSVTEVEPHCAAAMYNKLMYPPAERNPALVTAALAALVAPLAVLEARLTGGGWLIGGRFTAADLNLASVLFYLRGNPEALADKPAIRAWYAACFARPAAKAAMALRGD